LRSPSFPLPPAGFYVRPCLQHRISRPTAFMHPLFRIACNPFSLFFPRAPPGSGRARSISIPPSYSPQVDSLARWCFDSHTPERPDRGSVPCDQTPSTAHAFNLRPCSHLGCGERRGSRRARGGAVRRAGRGSPHEDTPLSPPLSLSPRLLTLDATAPLSSNGPPSSQSRFRGLLPEL
jgi:hypothetical protein